MDGADLSLVLSVFLASAVEAVEALTVVLAVGSTRRWSSALLGSLAALLALAAAVATAGPALTSLPIDSVRLAVGGLLLLLGLQWLRKAVLRGAGAKALHDELAVYAHEREAAATAPEAPRRGIDPYAFAVCGKTVALEGLEVVIIVLTFGANRGRIGLAAAAAAAAVAAVAAVGIVARAPLSRVPENQMKFAVGVLITSFGLFWVGEGLGLAWPGGEASLPVLVFVVLGAALAAIAALRRRPRPGNRKSAAASRR